MSNQKTWIAAKKFVKDDATCRLLAGAIVAANTARRPDLTALAAFRDRVKESGHDVSGAAYWSFLVIAACERDG